MTHVKNTAILDPLLHLLHKEVLAAASKGGFVLTVGGDHSIATGSISALKSVYPRLKVIWIDAHADIIQPSMSQYPNYHGMPVSHLMGWISQDYVPGFDWLANQPYLRPEDIVYIGIRDIDPDEHINLKKHNIKCFTPEHIDKIGIGQVFA